MKKVTCSSSHFICRRCQGGGREEPVEVLRDEIDTVICFCFLGDILNAGGECQTVVT